MQFQFEQQSFATTILIVSLFLVNDKPKINVEFPNCVALV